MELPIFEIADIFRDYVKVYMEMTNSSLPLSYYKVINAIENCRTKVLGGHKEVCDECKEARYSYNSCRNRHCPKCQFLGRENWIEKRTEDLLPVTYFHVVFTLPDLIRPIALRNKRIIYDMLFRAVNETIKTLCADPKHLGAEVGFIAVLHTWSQTLMDHPHMHVILPGGGITKEDNSWKTFKGNFFIHVKVLSELFRGKFLYYLKKAYSSGDLEFMGDISELGNENNFKKLVNALYKKEWVVFSKESFQGPQGVIKYLGRYTHRIAISNYRIKNIDNGRVTFSYRDSKAENKIKLMELKVEEFIRRFMLHVLPEKYMRIRYYGILANKKRKNELREIRKILKCEVKQKEEIVETWQEKLYRLTGFDVTRCPFCKKGRMQIVEKYEPGEFQIRAP